MIIIEWSTGQKEKKWFIDVLEANKWFRETCAYNLRFGITGKIVYQGGLD